MARRNSIGLAWYVLKTPGEANRVVHRLDEMLAQWISALALRYEDLNDHDRSRHDPLLAVLSGKKKLGPALAGRSTLNLMELSPAATSMAAGLTCCLNLALSSQVGLRQLDLMLGQGNPAFVPLI